MVSLEQLLDAGVHFGHQVRRWNPKMEPFIYGQRNGIHIIDIVQTLVYLEETKQFLTKQSFEGKTILFVGTKRQAAPIIKSAAEECDSFYVNQRWLGGMLTNWGTISNSITCNVNGGSGGGAAGSKYGSYSGSRGQHGTVTKLAGVG